MDFLEGYIPTEEKYFIDKDKENKENIFYKEKYLRDKKSLFIITLIAKFYKKCYSGQLLVCDNKIEKEAKEYIKKEEPKSKLAAVVEHSEFWNEVSYDDYFNFVFCKKNKNAKEEGEYVITKTYEDRAKELNKYLNPKMPELWKTFNSIADLNGNKKNKSEIKDPGHIYRVMAALQYEYKLFTQSDDGEKFPLKKTLKALAQFRRKIFDRDDVTMYYVRSIEDIAFVCAMLSDKPKSYEEHQSIKSLFDSSLKEGLMEKSTVIEMVEKIKNAFGNYFNKIESKQKAIKLHIVETYVLEIFEECADAKPYLKDFESVIIKGAKDNLNKLNAIEFYDIFKNIVIKSNADIDSIFVELICDEIIDKKIIENSENKIEESLDTINTIKACTYFNDDEKTRIKTEVTNNLLHLIKNTTIRLVEEVLREKASQNNAITNIVTDELSQFITSVEKSADYIKSNPFYFSNLAHNSIYRVVCGETSTIKWQNRIKELSYNTLEKEREGYVEESIKMFERQDYKKNFFQELNKALGFKIGEESVFDSEYKEVYHTRFLGDTKSMKVLRNLFLVDYFEKNDKVTTLEINRALSRVGFSSLNKNDDAKTTDIVDWMIIKAIELCKDIEKKKLFCKELLVNVRFCQRWELFY